MTARDVTNNLLIALAGSSQVAPTFWLNPANGVSYAIAAQVPQYRLDSWPIWRASRCPAAAACPA